jgi:hypothetical protein
MAQYKWITPTAVAIGLLVGCGGGGGGSGLDLVPKVPGTDVPLAAETNVGEVIQFARTQIANTSDSSDPLVLGNATLATSDTDEPAEI